ncbi:hypothetical protein [Lentilactobacillus buchneri]|uniref:hypothetical protein n=1 Tax=Lentilactobacillus buchneri TaxID=1581 RepID=UPI0020C08295|nr:hypothetical protein [Lentilactobacillus buchneri]
MIAHHEGYSHVKQADARCFVKEFKAINRLSLIADKRLIALNGWRPRLPRIEGNKSGAPNELSFF